jgi:hypothetical protein
MTDDIEPSDDDAWDDANQEAPSPVATDMPPARPRASGPSPTGTNVPEPSPTAVSEHFAAHLSETSASAFMYFCMAGVFRQADAMAFKLFRDRLMIECGSPADPIEVMLIEQLALAHLNTGRLHFRSATADSLEAARTYGMLAIALAGEMRRTALAIKSFRTRPQPVTLGAALPAGAAPAGSGGCEEDAIVGELVSNPRENDHGEGTIPIPESPARGSGEAESDQEARPLRRRA